MVTKMFFLTTTIPSTFSSIVTCIAIQTGATPVTPVAVYCIHLRMLCEHDHSYNCNYCIFSFCCSRRKAASKGGATRIEHSIDRTLGGVVTHSTPTSTTQSGASTSGGRFGPFHGFRRRSVVSPTVVPPVTPAAAAAVPTSCLLRGRTRRTRRRLRRRLPPSRAAREARRRYVRCRTVWLMVAMGALLMRVDPMGKTWSTLTVVVESTPVPITGRVFCPASRGRAPL